MNILEQAFQSAEDPMAIIVKGLFIKANPAFLKWSGYTEEEIIGKNFMDFAVDEAAIRDIHSKRVLDQDLPSTYLAEVKLKKGTGTFELIATKVVVSKNLGVFVIFKQVKNLPAKTDTFKHH